MHPTLKEVDATRLPTPKRVKPLVCLATREAQETKLATELLQEHRNKQKERVYQRKFHQQLMLMKPRKHQLLHSHRLQRAAKHKLREKRILPLKAVVVVHNRRP